MEAGKHRLPQRLSRCFAMNSPIDHSDRFFREQIDRLRAKGYSTEAAAEIVVHAKKAILEACRHLLERSENGEPLAEERGQGQS
jgi:hypothetical protein